MAAGDLTTLDKVKRDLGIHQSQDDVLLAEWITGASRWIVAYCNQPILAAEHALVLDGRGGSSVFLPYSPVTDVTLVKVGGHSYLPGTPGGSDTGYFFDRRGLLRLRGATFARGTGNVQVTFTAGYLTTPPEMERACTRLVGWRYKEKDRLAHQSKSVGGEVISYQTAAAEEHVIALLDDFKRVVPA